MSRLADKWDPVYVAVLERVGNAGVYDCWDDDGYYPARCGEPRELQLLYAAWACKVEIDNGGFSQFFLNPSGITGPEAVEGFRMIGLEEAADLVTEAIGFFGESYPRTRGTRERCLTDHADAIAPSSPSRAKWDPFYHLDERFYALTKHHFDAAADCFVLQLGVL